MFRDVFSRPSENLETIRKTMFCDVAKVRWEDLMNAVEMMHFEGKSGKYCKMLKKTIRTFTSL